MVKIDYKTMQQIVSELSNIGIFDKYAEKGALITFISRIWPIWTMKSSDKRFQSKAEDISQHYVKNSDASWEHLFVEELKLLSSPDLYLHFLNLLTCFDLYTSEAVFTKTLSDINGILGKYNLTYKKEDVFNPSKPYCKICEGNSEEILPPPSSLFPIYFVRSGATQDFCKCTFPCFLLEEDSWDDFGIKALFRLSYYESENQIIRIGKVKILFCSSTQEGERIAQRTGEYLPSHFFYLNKNFISLGQECSFYQNLISILDLENSKKFLYNLNDCAIFPDNLERISHFEEYRTSMIRFESANRAVRLARLVLSQVSVSNYFNLSLGFQPSYSNERVSIELNFNSQEMLPKRVYCVIGKNGVGKTLFLSNLPNLVREKNRISPFSKYLFISTCYSESFSKPEQIDGTTQFESCGLLEFRGNESHIKSPEEMKRTIKENIKKILSESVGNRSDPLYIDRISIFLSTLKIMFDDELIEGLISRENKIEDHILGQLCKHLSSGEFTLLYVISCIVAKIRVGSLLLFDEPETHLHPNAVSQLMRTIHELLDAFDSYAVITTHSPLVIREERSCCVLVMEKHGSNCFVRKIPYESLGGDLSELTREVFGTSDNQLYYKNKIIELLQSGRSEKEIIEGLISDNVPLGIGLKFFITNCFEK